MPTRDPSRIVPIERGKAYRRGRQRAIAAQGSLTVLKVSALAAVLGAGIGLASLAWPSHTQTEADTFNCNGASVTDGDTIRCGSKRIRLYGIDAPEMGGNCRPGRQCVSGNPDASKAHLQSLVRPFTAMECREIDVDHYGRIVARCEVNGIDLSCAQLDAGQAIRRYGLLLC